jgi:ABC-type bacteriocin/lantibiotic exporter with double-glycine peptidase domain
MVLLKIIKRLIVLSIVIVIVLGFFLLIFSSLLLLIPIVLVLIVIGLLWRLIRRGKSLMKEDGKRNKKEDYVTVEYKVKE